MASTVSAWGSDATQLDGMDLVDKAELVGVPFIITGIKPTVGARDVAYVYVEGEKQDGSTFTFNDSSSGVRAQIDAYVASAKLKTTLGEWTDVRLLIPRGLRVSTYEVQDERGRTKNAKTFYLTTAGRRA